MKFRHWPHYLVPIIVIFCSGALLAALSFAISGVRWRTSDRLLYIEMADATGVKLHSPVRYAGAVAGSVGQIRYLTVEQRRANPTRAVRITLLLNSDLPPLPSDLQASLGAETLLGAKFVALSAGTPEAPPLANGAVIQALESPGFDTIARSGQQTIEHVNHLLERLKADYPSLMPRLVGILEQSSSLVGQGSNFMDHADGIVTNLAAVVLELKQDYAQLVPRLNGLLDEGKGVATNASVAIRQVRTLIDRADGVIQTNQADLGKLVTELRVVSQNLKVISTYAKALTASLGEKPSRLIWGSRKTPLPSEDEILRSDQPLPIPSSNP